MIGRDGWKLDENTSMEEIEAYERHCAKSTLGGPLGQILFLIGVLGGLIMIAFEL